MPAPRPGWRSSLAERASSLKKAAPPHPDLRAFPWLPPDWVLAAVRRGRDQIGAAHGRLVPAPVAVLEMLLGQIDSRVVGLLVELGVPDALDEPATLLELAERVSAKAEALERLLSYAAARDLVARDGDRYAATALTRTLMEGPGSMAPFARFFASGWNADIWAGLGEALRDGGTAAEHALGMPFFDWLDAHPAEATDFHQGMDALSSLNRPWISERYDFTRYEAICDVGGGVGANLAAILQAAPQARGVLFDRPEVVQRGEARLATLGLQSRVTLAGGSFFETVPTGCDLYVLQAIVHDWGDEQMGALLRRIRAARAPGGRLLVIEACLPEGDGWHVARAMDLQMLVSTGTGRERTESQFRALFAAGGWELLSATETPMQVWIYELG